VAKGAPRLITADRSQIELRPFDLDSIIPQDHRARLLWQVLGTFDLSKFAEQIKAREGEAGRSATDPKVLVAVWLYATADGVGSAREVDRLCREHRAYQWICGKVPMNYHTLSDFRVKYALALDDLFTQILAVLMHKGLVELRRVSQDGLRVRASAGVRSFRRHQTLEKCLKQARQQVEEVKNLADDGSVNARQRAARERAAREREQRVNAAIAALKTLQERRDKKQGGQTAKGEPRGSTTDPQAHKMRMPDGGFRPAYNVQFAAATQAGVIVGVSVSDVGSDGGLAKPMMEQIQQRTGVQPQEFLGDGGYPDTKTINALSKMGIALYAPVAVRGDEDAHQPRPTDSAAVRQWRERMSTPEAKAIYKQRAATSERVNADVRTHRTLDRLLVRGLTKVTCVALWNAIVFNLLWMVSRT
jgi:transposase